VRLLVQVMAQRLVVRQCVRRGRRREDEREREHEDRQPTHGATQARHQPGPDAGDQARRQPRGDHAPERLSRAAGEPLQWQRVREPRADPEQSDVAQRVEPSDARCDRGEHHEHHGARAQDVAGDGAKRHRHRQRHSRSV
jgi:hypothetical protein